MRKGSHFDNVGASTTLMIVMSQLVNWAILMYGIMNAQGPDLVPGYKENWY